MQLRTPTDVRDCNSAWGAACGPCSIAAVLNRQVADVRQFLRDDYGKRRAWMTPTDVKAALNAAGVKWTGLDGRFPEYGLAFLQFGGWEAKPVKVQYRYTHWIGVQGRRLHESVEPDQVFELNAEEGVVAMESWRREIPVMMIEEKWGNGKWSVRLGIEVHI